MDFIHFSNMLLKASTAEQAFVAVYRQDGPEA